MFTFLAFLSFHFMSKSLKEISAPRRVVGSNKVFILICIGFCNDAITRILIVLFVFCCKYTQIEVSR